MPDLSALHVSAMACLNVLLGLRVNIREYRCKSNYSEAHREPPVTPVKRGPVLHVPQHVSWPGAALSSVTVDPSKLSPARPLRHLRAEGTGQRFPGVIITATYASRSGHTPWSL